MGFRLPGAQLVGGRKGRLKHKRLFFTSTRSHFVFPASSVFRKSFYKKLVSECEKH